MRDLSKLKQILQEADDAVGSGVSPSQPESAAGGVAPAPSQPVVAARSEGVESDIIGLLAPALAREAAPEPVGTAESAAAAAAAELTAIVERRRGVDRRGPRASSSLQPAWIDPEEMPFTPQPRPGNPIASRIFSLGVLGVFLAAIAWLIVPEVHFRVVHQDEVQFSGGILTAQGVPLGPLEAAVVEEILVDDLSPDATIAAGTPLARLRTRGTSDDGTTVYYDVSAPFDARLVSIGAPEGSTTQPGIPVLTVYDPNEMMVIVTVNQDDLDMLRQGMAVSLHSELFGEAVAGELVAAVPILGTAHDPVSSTLVNLKIRPNLDQIDDLLPGLQFDVVIDLDSAPRSAPQLLYTTNPALAGEAAAR